MRLLSVTSGSRRKVDQNCALLGCGPGSVVSIATGYWLDGPRIESRWGKIFRTCPDRPWGPPSLLYNGYRVFSGGKERPGRDVDPSPLLVPWSKKDKAIPILPLWAARPVQILSACTRMTFTLYLLLGYYAASSGNSLPDVWGQPVGRIFKGQESFKGGADRLSRNVGKELPLLAAL
jgi:hypothetical protein